jgi:hypothetical protein
MKHKIQLSRHVLDLTASAARGASTYAATYPATGSISGTDRVQARA